MEYNDIKNLLLQNFQSYKNKPILLEDLTTRISNLPKKYQLPLIAWLQGGELPDFSHSNYSVKGLVLKGFTVPSAVLTVAWLEYDTVAALRGLRHAGVRED